MAKLTDKELQYILDKLNSQGPGGVKTPEPAFRRYRKHFLRDMDFEQFQKFSPEELIRSARTSEELFTIREQYLDKLPNEASGEPWWNYYNARRVELGQRASIYDIKIDPATGKASGIWGVPVSPEIVLKQGAANAKIHNQSVNRRLHSSFGDWEQVTGKRQLFNVVEDGTGYSLRNWSGIKPPTLKSNLPASTLFFDVETTGLLGKEANIISLGTFDTTTKSVFAEFDLNKKYTGKVGQIVNIWKRASAGEAIISEKQLVKGFISRLKETGAEEALMGYNIKSFDIPMMYEVAKRHGLYKELDVALSGKQIIDVADYAKAFLSQKLGGRYVSWQAGMVEELGMNPLGWQLEALAEAFNKHSGTAHNAADDAKMTMEIWKTLQDTSKWDKVDFNEERYLASVRKNTGKGLLRVSKELSTVNLTGRMGVSEAPYLKTIREHLEELYPGRLAKETVATVGSKLKDKAVRGINTLKGKAVLGSAIGYGAAFVASNMLFPGSFWQNAISSAAATAAHIGTKKLGYGGWKPFAAAIAANTLTSVLWYSAANKLGQDDVAVSAVGNRFSGFDDAYNTVQGLHEGGMAPGIRHQLTEFGSGYQGPNPWLNPSYNEAKEIERYKLMRASKIGLSEQELYKYFTQEEEPSEYLAATASAGTALHLLEEARAVKEGRVTAAEEFVYDPQAMMTGHIDISYRSGAPVDIKTLSAERFAQVAQQGAFPRHIHQLNWYMQQKNAQTGYLEYINRDDVSQRLTMEIAYNPAMYEQDIQKLTRVRRRIEQEIEAGILNEALLPKTASLATLKAAAVEETAAIQANIHRISYLEDVYQEEMKYLRSVASNRQRKARQEQHDREALDGRRFSGFDDSYNTIEAFSHKGMAKLTRKALTAFGSGYQSDSDSDFNPLLGIGLVVAGVAGSAILLRHRQASRLLKSKPGGGTWRKISKDPFSRKQISELASFAKTATNEEMAEKVGLNIVKPGDLSERFKGALEGGAFVENVAGAGFFSPETVSDFLTKDKNFQKIGLNFVDDEIRILGNISIAHEATEYKTLKHLGIFKNKSFAYDTDTVAHRLAVTHEEMLLREIGNQSLYNKWAKTRMIYDPHAMRDLFGGNVFSGFDDAYNTIQGLRHGGMAEDIRKVLTDFGSGWDPLRNIAKEIFGDSKNPMLKMLRDKEFKQALSIGKQIRELGEGKFGKTFLYETTYKNKKIPYVIKESLEGREELLKREYVALKSISGDIMPTAYGIDKNKLFMEYMPGETLESLIDNDIVGKKFIEDVVTPELNKQIDVVAKRGFENLDIAPRNIMYDIESGKVSWIDFGLARREADEYSQENMLGAFKASTVDVDLKETSGLADLLEPEGLHPNASKLLKDQSTSGVTNIRENTPFGSGYRGPEYDYLSRLGTSPEDLGIRRRSDGIISQRTFSTAVGKVADALGKVGARAKLAAEYIKSRAGKIYTEASNKLTKPIEPIPGDDDSYNTIEGFGHKGLAKLTRQTLTSFGSGWDALKALVKDEGFQAALKAGKKVKTLGKGKFGKAFLYETTHKGKTFQYVMKEAKKGGAEALRTEFKALTEIGGDIMPTAYGTSSRKTLFGGTREQLFMEYMPGKTARSFGKNLPEDVGAAIREQISQVAEKGYINPDIHLENVLYDPKTKRTSWIDFGNVLQKEGYESSVLENVMKEKLGEKIPSSIIPKRNEAFNTIDGLHAGASKLLKDQSAAGTTTVRGLTDFGSATTIGKRFIKDILESGLANKLSTKTAGEALEPLYKKYGIKRITDVRELTKVGLDPSKIKTAVGGYNKDFGKWVYTGTTEQLEARTKGIADITGKSNLFSTAADKQLFQAQTEIHEMLESIYGERGSYAKATKFGSHRTSKVIQNEAAIAYALGPKAFEQMKALREKEISTVLGGLELLEPGELAERKVFLKQQERLAIEANKIIKEKIELSSQKYQELRSKFQEADIDSKKTIRDEIKQVNEYRKTLANERKEQKEILGNITKIRGVDALRRYKRTVPEIYEKTPQQVSRQIRRMKRFNEISTEAVGIGHRAAKDAGRKHSGYRSTKPLNSV